eukprot:1682404-Prymnesium_polylepis.1
MLQGGVCQIRNTTIQSSFGIRGIRIHTVGLQTLACDPGYITTAGKGIPHPRTYVNHARASGTRCADRRYDVEGCRIAWVAES